MEKIINFKNLRQFAYLNDKVCEAPIRGIVVGFRGGLNKNEMFNEEMPEGIYYGQKGILYVAPYNRPWAWMNRQAVNYTDEIMDVLFNHFNFPENFPIVSTGSSMGGQSALVYSLRTKRTPVACVVSCPVCDLVYHFEERFDTPRSLYGAFFEEEGTLIESLKNASPFYMADDMPKINYHIFHSGNDTRVNIDRHSERFVAKMRDLGHSITYDIAEGKEHGELTEELALLFKQFCVTEIENIY